MHLEQLTIDGFRNYSSQSLRACSHFNLLTGRNAQGKSNLIEAIYSLSLGRSFRTGREEEVIGENSPFARVAGNLTEGSEPLTIEVLWERGSPGHTAKTIRYNHKVLSRLSDFIDKAPMVLLTHDDLDIIRGEPGIRRKLLDLAASRLMPGYLSDLREYGRILNAKNLFLKLHPSRQDRELYEVYQEKLASLGSSVIFRRLKMLESLKESFNSLYLNIFNQKPPAMEYRSSVTGIGELSQKGILEAFRRTQERHGPFEKIRRFTLGGPHRDDLEIRSYNGPLRKFSSMGEIRSAAVVLKLSEIDMISKLLKREPVVLIDDCLNEFDGERINLFFEYLLKNRQIFYTATRYFPHFDKIDNPAVFRIEKGVIEPCSLSRLQNALT